jgi:hypothetical protein
VSTKVFETVNFSNTQAYKITATLDVENVTQLTTVDSTTTTHDGALVFEQVRHVAFPLTANISFVANPDGTFAQKTKIVQKFEINDTERANGVPIFLSILSNGVTATDDLLVNSSFQITGNQGQASWQDYFSFDTLHGCYSHSLTAANNVLTGITKGQGCNSVPNLGGQ